MKKITQFKRKNSLSKTIRMRLIPVGNTEENLKKKRLIEVDEERAENYKIVKGCIDEYHRAFIDDVLSMVELEGLAKYADIYYMSHKDDSMTKKMEEMEKDFRKQISKAFTSDVRYSKLFKAGMIKELLPNYFVEQEQRAIIEKFNDFTTYFSSFSKARENMYSMETKSCTIANRIVADNLPRFLDNCNIFKAIKAAITRELQDVANNYNELLAISLEGMFEVRAFSLVLSHDSIMIYNKIVGEINKHIYNYSVSKRKRLPLLKSLFKQILSENNGISFVSNQFKEDQEVLDGIREFYIGFEDTLLKIEKLFEEFNIYDLDMIYVRNDQAVTSISKCIFGEWNVVINGWNAVYDSNSAVKNKESEKYIEKRKKAYKEIKSFSLKEIEYCGGVTATSLVSISDYFIESVQTNVDKIRVAYEDAKDLLSEPYDSALKLNKEKKAIAKLKALLDAIKELEGLLKLLRGTGKESEKDENFYGEFLPLCEKVMMVDLLYNKVRSYVTKRPYSKDKIKLNFDNPQLLGGWDKNKEREYRTVILRKDGDYYLAIMDKSNSKVFVNYSYNDGEEAYEKMEYKLIPGPNKMFPKVFFAKSNEAIFTPSPEILQIRKRESFKKNGNFNIKDCRKMIDFFKECIDKHDDWRKFNFSFKPTEKYNDISEFYKDVKDQAYSVTFKYVSKAYIDEMVNTGNLYLFRIYNKDFSKASKGTPNLHTMYFKMLFDENNLKDVVYQLNGEAEMFYRKASLEKGDSKKQTAFKFDLYKDKRFTENQFFIHFPITLNYKADNVFNINGEVRRAIKKCESNYVIGIDRGEKHLIYISVIDSCGNIVEQHSLNEIVNNCNGKTYRTDYNALVQKKETGRIKARQDWTTIESVKDLKEGYLSQVVHKVCELVMKYDAIVAMEDLESGFKNKRKLVEKEVYQKFEKMLAEKLAYLVDKNKAIKEDGGLLNALQLTNKPGNLDKAKQDGFIMYVPVWLTSNIDPTTGFVNLFKFKKGMSLNDMRDFFYCFDAVRYNENDDLFEFEFNYDNFIGQSISYKKKWTVCSYGERVELHRKTDDSNDWDGIEINLTDAFKQLFDQYGISLEVDLKEAILSQRDERFFRELLRLYRLTLQMSNSMPGEINKDYIISPVRDENGKFFDSRNLKDSSNDIKLPQNIVANGAYNIARKALYAVDVIKSTDDNDLDRAKIYPNSSEWLEYVQK